MSHRSDTDPGPLLLAHARDAIARRLGVDGTTTPASTPALTARGACFVTLHLNGDLRGCIGSIDAQRPLVEDVRSNAVAAATQDARFAPLTAAELCDVHIEVSVLSEPQPLEVADEAELLAKLRPGVDGVLLASGRHHATFLPQVWAQLPEPALFVAALKQKAGLPPDRPAPGLKVSTYSVRHWNE